MTSKVPSNNSNGKKPHIDRKSLQETADKACQILGYSGGFYLAIFDQDKSNVVEAINAMSSNPVNLNHCTSKIRYFKDYCSKKNIDPSCRGTVKIGDLIWSTAGKTPAIDDAICAYLAVLFSTDITTQEWMDITTVMVKNQHFIKLDQCFMKLGSPSVRYEKVDTE